MPATYYCGTVTFQSHMDYDRKKELIDKLPLFFSKYLMHTATSEYYLYYSIEYHKVHTGSKDDDPQSPHVHFILFSYKKLGKCHVNGISSALRDYYGRSQFRIATPLYLDWYKTYMCKDVEKNDLWLGFPHYFETRLEEPYTQASWEELFDDL